MSVCLLEYLSEIMNFSHVAHIDGSLCDFFLSALNVCDYIVKIIKCARSV